MGRKPIRDPARRKQGLDVLRYLGRYYALDKWQLCRLLQYSPKAISDISATLKKLKDAGYIASTDSLPRRGANGGAPAAVHWLKAKGYRYLRDVGEEPGYKLHHDENQAKSDSWLVHNRDLNDALIAFELFGTTTPGVELLSFMHDVELSRFDMRLEIDGRRQNVVPDGYVAYGIGANKGGFTPELDHGTEKFNDPHQSTTWTLKIKRFKAFASGPYLQIFLYTGLKVPFVIKPLRGTPETRLRNLLDWTEVILKDEPEWGDLFRFTIVDPMEMSPQEFVSGPHWIAPFSRRNVSLVDLTAVQLS